MIERLKYALRWLRTQWRYRREVRAWGWAEWDGDTATVESI